MIGLHNFSSFTGYFLQKIGFTVKVGSVLLLVFEWMLVNLKSVLS
jgi:hypothetical protein